MKMGRQKKSNKEESKKYARQNKLAANRQQKYRDKMSEEQKAEYRKKARERYQKRKAENKVKFIKELTAKEQKEKRKRWKKDSKMYREKKKMQEKALQDTPPQSGDEQDIIQDMPQQVSRQHTSGRKKVRRDKAKAYRELKKKDEKILNLERKLEKYKKQMQRLKKSKSKSVNQTPVSPSPSKQVKEVIGKNRATLQVRRRLFIGFALEKQLKTQLKSVSPKTKETQILRKVVGTKILRKYRLQNDLKHILPYKCNKHDTGRVNLEYSRKMYRTIKVQDSKTLQQFFEDDTVSKMCPGKKDLVKKGKVTKQRRILLDSMKNLYLRFVKENGKKISYSTFTRVRPFWVQPPNARDRETCACIIHENMQLLVNALKRANVIKFANVNNLVDCPIEEVEFYCDKVDKLKFYQWKTALEIKVIKGVSRKIRKTVKCEVCEPISKVKKLFFNSLEVFNKHVANLRHQARTFKQLKKSLKDGELIFHIDFSQNYVAKYATEIQATHFGASKHQISLHTGLMYYRIGEETKSESFCTLSDNLDHHAHGVWAHMMPILEETSERFPDTHTVNVFSDSPSSQYRNRTNIYLMKKILPKMFKKIKCVTWNFSEPGHGKGAMDGVGGHIKRSADLEVKHGKDITCAADIVSALNNKTKTRLVEIPYTSIETAQKALPKSIPEIKGIMSLRQITFSNAGSMFGRKLSCFDCTVDEVCPHYGVMQINIGEEAENESSTKRKNHHNTKKVLKVSDVYTSSDESDIGNCPLEEEDDGLSTIVKDSSTNSIDPEDIQAGIFVIVNVKNEKNNVYRYVAVCSSAIEDNGEVEVTFAKRVGEKNTSFKIIDNDISYIHFTDIDRVLSPPNLVIKGDRIFYEFEFEIDVHK